MKIKLLIFDFDGVLVNSEDVFTYVLHEELVTHGLKISFDEVVSRFTGHDTFDMIAELIKEQKVLATAEEIFNALLLKKPTWMKGVMAMPHAEELLEKISGRIPYCLASNSDTGHINLALETTGLQKFFEPSNIFSAPEIGPSKPHPNVYLQALATMGVQAEDAMAIEDSVPGLTAAHAAKIPVVGFLSNPHGDAEEHGEKLKSCGAFTLIRSLEEVTKIIDI